MEREAAVLQPEDPFVHVPVAIAVRDQDVASGDGVELHPRLHGEIVRAEIPSRVIRQLHHA